MVVLGVVSVAVTVVMVLVSVVVEIPEVAGTIVELCDEDEEAGVLALLDGELEALEGGLIMRVDELVDEETWTLDSPVLLLGIGLAEDETIIVVLVVKSEFNEAGVGVEVPGRDGPLGLEAEGNMAMLVLPEWIDADVELVEEVGGTITVVGELMLAAMGATNVGFGALVCCTRSIQTLPAIAPMITGVQSREGIVSNAA